MGIKKHRTHIKKRTLQLEKLEGRQLLTSYFIDPNLGDDHNSGMSPTAAYRTVANLVSRYVADRPDGFRQIVAGDEIVFMPGEHNFTYLYANQVQSLFLRDVHGTVDQPIVIRGMEGAKLHSKAPDGSELSPIYILQSSNVVIRGLDISSYGSGITIAGAENVVVESNVIHDVDGVAANNVSGVYLSGAKGALIRDNKFQDNYDRSKLGNENNRHIVVFGSPDVRILNNTFIQTTLGTGNGVAYKHLGGLRPEDVGTFEVAYNQFMGGTEIAIGTAAPNSHIHHNLIVDAGEIRVADQGGGHQLANELIEFNTIVTTQERLGSASLHYNPTLTEGFPMGPVTFAHNFIVDQRQYNHTDKSTIIVSQYGLDPSYIASIGQGLLHVEGNVYETSDAPRFNIFGSDHLDRLMGQVYDWQEWLEADFVAKESQTSLPLDDLYSNADAQSQHAGWQSETTPPTPPEPMTGVYAVPGTVGSVRVLSAAVLERLAEYNNEIGIAYVDNAAGSVDGIAPNDTGWLQRLLGRNQHHILFQSGGGEGDIASISIEAGRFVVFYLVQDASLEQWRTANPENALDARTNIFTSVQNSNPDLLDHVHEDILGEKWKLAWEDLDGGGDLSFRDLVLSIRFNDSVCVPSVPPSSVSIESTAEAESTISTESSASPRYPVQNPVDLELPEFARRKRSS